MAFGGRFKADRKSNFIDRGGARRNIKARQHNLHLDRDEINPDE